VPTPDSLDKRLHRLEVEEGFEALREGLTDHEWEQSIAHLHRERMQAKLHLWLDATLSDEEKQETEGVREYLRGCMDIMTQGARDAEQRFLRRYQGEIVGTRDRLIEKLREHAGATLDDLPTNFPHTYDGPTLHDEDELPDNT